MILAKLLLGWPMRIVLAAFATLIAPVVYIVSLITVIGLPIALIAMFVPAAAALYVSAELLYRLVFRRALPRRNAIWASIAVPIVGAVIVAQLANAALDTRTAQLVAGDRDEIAAGPIRKLALVSGPLYVDKDVSTCRELCLRLLLAGAVDEALVATVKSPVETLDPDMPATAVRFTKNDGACASKRIQGGDERIEGAADAALVATTPIDAAERARLRIAAGECLEEKPSRIGAADAALVATKPANGAGAAARAGLDPFADTLRAERLSFFRKEGGAFREDYRRTMAWVLRHPPIAVPVVLNGYAFETNVGFARLTRRVNVPDRYQERPDRAEFLREKLGLNLALESLPAPDRRALVDGYIAGAPADSIAARDVIEDFITDVAQMSRAPLSRADAERLVAILNTGAIELPFNSPSAAAKIAASYPDLAPAMAAALFDRIETAPPGARQSRYNDSLIRIAARALALLPDATLAAERPRLLRLLADKDRRADAAPLFSRLAAGPTAADDLVAVVDAALAVRGEKPDGEAWRELYHAGLTGLCRVAAPAAADALMARFSRDPELKRHFRELTISILIKSGEQPSGVRALYAPGLDERGLADLDGDIDRASRMRCD